jgi:hypothetical protein
MSKPLPFEESQISESTYLRTFYQDVDSGDLHWHRDRETRIIESIEITDWKIQIDNELPKSLNQKVEIPVGVWHRLIKGSGDLKIKMVKIIN